MLGCPTNTKQMPGGGGDTIFSLDKKRAEQMVKYGT